MKSNALVTAILMTGVLFTSCKKEEMDVIPSAKITTANLSVSGVKSIDVSGIFQVYVSFSATEETAYIEANENLHSLINVHQDGDRLVIGLKKNVNFNGVPVLILHVKTATLNKVIAQGKSNVEFKDHLVNNKFEVDLTGASKLKGSVETDNLIAKIEGDAILELAGSANNFQIDADGGSEMTGYDFTANHLKAYLNGGCEIHLTVMQTLDVEAIGASKVYYKGHGTIVHQNLTGGSEIIKVN